MNKQFIAALFCFVCFAPTAICGTYSPDTATKLSYREKQFTITFPADWVEIPQSVLRAYEARIHKLGPSTSKQHYDYGFQLQGSSSWFQYPYVLVQIRDTGRISKSDLSRLTRVSVGGTVQKTKQELAPLMTKIDIGKMYYDKKSEVIWLRMHVGNTRKGPISGISGMVLTQNGYIQISSYALDSNYPRYAPVFKSITQSVMPDPSIAYKAKWSDSLPAFIRNISMENVIKYALIGAFLGLASGFWNKRAKKKSNR